MELNPSGKAYLQIAIAVSFEVGLQVETLITRVCPEPLINWNDCEFMRF